MIEYHAVSRLRPFTTTAFAAKTGTFTAELEATPGAAPTDSVIGLSNGSQAAHMGYAALVRFAPNGSIDARNGAAYQATTKVVYAAGTTYRFRLVVNVSAHTYSIFVSSNGGADQTIGMNYAFRTEQAAVTQLNHWGVESTMGATRVCGFLVQ